MKKKALTIVLFVSLMALPLGCKKQQRPADASEEEVVEQPSVEGDGEERPEPQDAASYVKRVGFTHAFLIEARADGLYLEGEQVTPLGEDLRVPANVKEGGESSLLIDPLLDALRGLSDAGEAEYPDRTFDLIGLFTEGELSYRLITEVLYTSGQGLKPPSDDSKVVTVSASRVKFKLMVRRGDGGWDGFNVVTPRLALGAGEIPPEEKPPEIMIGEDGVRVLFMGALVPPVEGCPAMGATICAQEGVDTSELLARYAEASGAAQRQEVLVELERAYNLRLLYNELVTLQPRQPENTVIHVAAEEGMPMALVAAALRTIRERREGGAEDGTFASDEAFEQNAPAEHVPNSARGEQALYPDVVLTLAM